MILKKTKVNSFTVQHKNFKHLLEHQGYSLELQNEAYTFVFYTYLWRSIPA